jgi:hypothetical protein
MSTSLPPVWKKEKKSETQIIVAFASQASLTLNDDKSVHIPLTESGPPLKPFVSTSAYSNPSSS